ncbi:MAG: leucine--tRNA ligase [Bacteroidota bacterium]
MKYPFKEIEHRWQKYWEERGVNKVDLSKTERKLYALVMFLYPSGDKLHIGHWYNYGPTDTWARFKKLQGFNVFEPIGYDAFGLPAENYAIKTGVHPQDSTNSNIDHIRKQLRSIGAMYDFDYEVNTSAPEYYKWTQWVFLQLYKNGLAYRAEAPVNWCPSCQTVLANEQVIDGACERCGTFVVQKTMTQWFFRITAYAEELLQDLDKLDWPAKTITMQRNWIGKSNGVEITFKVKDTGHEFKVFTTRPDTLFGVTYVVLAPEHPLVQKITSPEQREAVDAYIEMVSHETEIERTFTEREKTGVFTGSYAVNPANGEEVPIWIADYVLARYGTGAVMAVPAHDERDFEFATKYHLPIRKVILQPGTHAEDPLATAYTEPGIMIASGKYTGLNSEIGIERITDDLEASGVGQRKVYYRLRDWLVSRQRYWGAPIPIVYCAKCGEVPVPENQLPVSLPYNVDFKPTGESPLARSAEFVNTRCPSCGGPAKRDVDTMDTFVCSSWYYLRYLSPHLDTAPFDKELVARWLPVDKYVGGAEHAVMHLLYARFVTKALRDAGWLSFDEPFTSLVHQGTITNRGAKMSKSRGNVVNPDTFVERYGSDTFRMYLMFMGPYDEGGDWSDKGIVGVHRFLNRVYDFVATRKSLLQNAPHVDFSSESVRETERPLYRKLHQTIKKVTEDLEAFRFNTAVAALMELYNELSGTSSLLENGDISPEFVSYVTRQFVVLLSPFAPHLAEELHAMIGEKGSIFCMESWPGYDAKAIVAEEVTVVAQVNGKIRAKFLVPIDEDETLLKERVLADPNVKRHIEGKEIVRMVVVKNKLINVVVK